MLTERPATGTLLPDGLGIGLVDFGQVKQLSSATRLALARLIVAMSELDPKTIATLGAEDAKRIADLGRAMGAKLRGDSERGEAEPDLASNIAAAAVCIWLFDSIQTLPGGYSSNELSPDSPLKEVSG